MPAKMENPNLSEAVGNFMLEQRGLVVEGLGHAVDGVCAAYVLQGKQSPAKTAVFRYLIVYIHF
jgi:hypothetical protein